MEATKREKLHSLMSDLPDYIVADVTKICDEYQARNEGETIAKSYVVRLYGTSSERVQFHKIPQKMITKIKDLIYSFGSKRQLKRAINQLVI